MIFKSWMRDYARQQTALLIGRLALVLKRAAWELDNRPIAVEREAD